MMKLKCGGRPVNTCLQLFKSASLPELLSQQAAFLSFAEAHLNWDRESEVWINLLKPEDEWDDEDDEQFSSQKVQDFGKAVCDHCSSLPESGEKAELIRAVTGICLLSRISLEKMREHTPETLLSAMRGQEDTVTEALGCLMLADEPVIELMADQTVWHVKYDPYMELPAGAVIRTYCVQVRKLGAAEYLLLSLDGEDREQGRVLEIPRGQRCYFNAVDGVVTAVLPNRLENPLMSLSRNLSNQLCRGPEPLAGTEGATSFALAEKSDDYIWIVGGRTGGSYCGRHNTDMTLIHSKDIVEADLRLGFYYLLQKNGLLKTNDPSRKGLKHISSLASVWR